MSRRLCDRSGLTRFGVFAAVSLDHWMIVCPLGDAQEQIIVFTFKQLNSQRDNIVLITYSFSN